MLVSGGPTASPSSNCKKLEKFNVGTTSSTTIDAVVGRTDSVEGVTTAEIGSNLQASVSHGLHSDYYIPGNCCEQSTSLASPNEPKVPH